MIRGVLLDLDGTVYYGKNEVPGAAAFIGRLDELGIDYLFVTNRSNRTPEVICEHLAGYGIPCSRERVLTSAQATAEYLGSGSVYYIGEDGLRIALEEEGLVIADENPDYVVVSFDREFNYDKLKKACRLIDKGSKFIATNPDSGLKTEDGILPGTGSIVAAVEAGCRRKPLMIGKPEKLIFEMALRRMNLPAAEVIAVGDNLETDIPAGAAAGIRTVLLLQGISTREDIAGAAADPTWVADTYDELARIIEAENG